MRGKVRPRLAVLSRNLPPLTGGMERLSWQVIKALAADFEVHVIGPRDCLALLPEGVPGHACHGAAALPYLCEAALVSVWRAVVRLRPDLVLATSGLTAPLARIYAGLCGRPYLTMVHGLDLVADNALYQRLFVPSLRGATRVIANSANTAHLALSSGVPATALRIIHPGVEWPAPGADGNAFRQRHDLGARPVMLMVGRQTARKGLVEFIEHGLPAIVQAMPDALLVVVGGAAQHAIRRENSIGPRLAAAITKRGLQSAVRMLGALGDAELAAAYAAANVHVFPLVAVRGDVEGFGMVAVEAAAHGLPTVAFDEGGVRDAMVEGSTGEVLKPGDYPAFVAAVLKEFACPDVASRRATCRAAAARFAWPHHDAAWRQLTTELLPGPATKRP